MSELLASTMRVIGVLLIVFAITMVCSSTHAQTSFFGDRLQELEARILQLEAENADLRAQLLARDIGKKPVLAASKIIMQSIPGCDSCEQWYATERPKLIEVGWVVERETVTTFPAGRKFPRWRVCLENGCTEIEYCSANQFMDRLRKLVGRKY